jgi:hypothetical protein
VVVKIVGNKETFIACAKSCEAGVALVYIFL